MTERIADQVRETIDEVKPHLRGWLHAADRAAGAGRRDRAGRAVPDPDDPGRLGDLRRLRAGAVHRLGASTTAARWSPRTGAVAAALRPLQHLPADRRQLHAVHAAAAARRGPRVLLSVVWARRHPRASLFRVFWTGAPRWLYTPIYIALGWAARLLLRRAFVDRASTAVIVLIGSAAAALHARRRDLRLPRPEPVPALVRVPRGVPHADDRRPSSPTTSGLDRDVLPALSLR